VHVFHEALVGLGHQLHQPWQAARHKILSWHHHKTEQEQTSSVALLAMPRPGGGLGNAVIAINALQYQATTNQSTSYGTYLSVQQSNNSSYFAIITSVTHLAIS
jgi:hypothetical protein